MKRTYPIFFILLLLFIPFVSADTEVEIYRDGYVHIEQVISVDELTGVTETSLLATLIENLYVTDNEETPLYYDIEGIEVKIYNLESDYVIVAYDTAELTMKQGGIWTFQIETSDDTQIFLPEDSTILYVEPLPQSIDLEKNSISIEADSDCTLDYIFGLEEPDSHERRWILIPISIIFIIIVSYWSLKRKKRPKKSWKSDSNLEKLEKKVLDYVWENEDVMEAEIRSYFNIPKTSSWRMMKRLEGYGYIAITKKNKVNIISIKKMS